MSTQTIRDNQALLEFWDQAFFIPETEKEVARQEGAGSWEALAPSEKLLRAACMLGSRKKVLDYGCGNGWASIAAAKSGCPDVTAADPAPHAPESAAEKGLLLTDDCLLYQDGVLRMVSRTDEEWAALFAPFFTVESLDHFAWPGENEEKRRLFRLRKGQTA